MKQCSAFFFMITATLILCNSLNAASLSIGGNIWYNWWKPAWYDGSVKNRQIGYNGEIYNDFSDFSTRAGFLYGPAISLQLFDNFSISSVFMYGNFNFRSSGYDKAANISFSTLKVSGGFLIIDTERKVKRWDSDSIISYSITRVVSLFVGFKAQGYSYRELYRDMTGTNGFKSEVSIANYGPGLGISFMIPLWGKFYAQCTGSVILLNILEEYNFRYGSVPNALVDRSARYLAWGATSTLGLIYNISEINTSVKVGFRYQFLNYRQKESQIAYEQLDGKKDHIYGVTFSVVYTFDFGI